MSSFDECNLHGSLGVGRNWSPPDQVTKFDVNARLTFTNIKAHEYTDTPQTMREKVQELASLIRASRNMIAYTGAGISTSAGINDYATKAKATSVSNVGKPVLKDWKLARPTIAHHTMVALYKTGYLKYWVQQNHDSLPQKAGYPQHMLNEIHGSLHDPANPIVPYEGSLRDDLYASMERWKKASDLCLALGTSLSGFNADSVAEEAAVKHSQGRGLGLVIINLQETPYDNHCSLRIFGKLDDVMSMLAEELSIASHVHDVATYVNIPQRAPGSEVFDEETGELNPDAVLIPFGQNGMPLQAASAEEVDVNNFMKWDLSIGKRVKLTGGPYAGDVGTVVEKNADGHYRIRFADSVHPMFNVLRRPFSLWLGNWHLAEASFGYGIEAGGPVPFVNVD
jgi:NAD-dependent SIR2 family protein deacetylase